MKTSHNDFITISLIWRRAFTGRVCVFA